VPRVTVVMAVYNAAQFVREAVASVLAQTFRDFELIIVDDSSFDDSLSIVESFDDTRIRIIRHQSNVGAASSRNDALAAARGDLVAIMDADEVCAPTRLERQVVFLDANPQVGLVGCAVYDNIDASGAVLGTSFLPTDNETIQQSLTEKWCFLHSSITFRRALQKSIGGYRTEFEPAEDHDFVLRVLEHSEGHNLHERLVSYRLNPESLSVVGHQYIDELRAMAIRLARRRRSGQSEDLGVELQRLSELEKRPKASRGQSTVVQRWRNSFYVADRYYGFGYRGLCAGDLEIARRGFVESLRVNAMFAKSWIGFAISFMLFAANRVRFVFQRSDFMSW